MIDLKEKDYLVIVQCHIVKQRCSGYFCEKAFHERTGGFVDYPKNKEYRKINLTCGGCCGRAIHRKLGNLIRQLKKREEINKSRIVVQLSSCITKDNFHSVRCHHIDYMKSLIAKYDLDVCEDTKVSDKSEQQREAGIYKK